MCHVYVRADNLAGVLISDHEYPHRVAHTLITKVSYLNYCIKFRIKVYQYFKVGYFLYELHRFVKTTVISKLNLRDC